MTFVAKSPSRPRANGVGDERRRRDERALFPECYTVQCGNVILGIMVTGYSSTASLSLSREVLRGVQTEFLPERRRLAPLGSSRLQRCSSRVSSSKKKRKLARWRVSSSRASSAARQETFLYLTLCDYINHFLSDARERT